MIQFSPLVPFSRRVGSLLAGLAVAGCVANTAPVPVAAVKPAVLTPVAASDALPATEAAAETASAQMVWALRGGLNVAALLCQDRLITDNYNRMLKVHRNILDEAYAAEQRRFRALHGNAGQDRHSRAMTRLYNGFASVPDRRRFCTMATRIVADMVAMPSALVAANARRALTTLEPGAVQLVNSAN
ncbi:hypothetical protein [Sandarakinorhabdus sp.]|uniref:hypothetical protein n=1 Tax=Sandarakinorhabdus sp. TaxID=1916663 RepID=UPI0033401B24